MPPLLIAALTQLARGQEVIPTRTIEAPSIDGDLSEAAWQTTPAITGFLMVDPKEGDPAPDTEVRLLVDDRHLYVGVRAAPSKHPPTAPIVARDQLLFHDWVEILLDPFQKGRSAFAIRVNARGVQEDAVFVEGEGLWAHDTSWDTVFRSEGRIHEDGGWTVEVAIPFRSLRYPSVPEQRWGVTLLRFTPRPWSLYAWPRLTDNAPSTLGQAATLGPFAAPPPRLRLEVQPTLTGSLTQVAGQALGWGLQPGGSGRWGVTSALALDAAVNPDFSQIEADAPRVTSNIKFPLEFEEKRPLFLEAADLMTTPLPLLYTRSIADPLAALKFTGRAGPVAIGVLGSVDEQPTASTVTTDLAEGASLPGWRPRDVRGATAVASVARLRFDTGDGGGAGVVFHDKELIRPTEDTLANRVLAFDAQAEMGDHLSTSVSAGGSTLDVSDGGTSLLGAAWVAELDRSGRTWEASLEQRGTTAGFRAENGFLTEVDRYGGALGLTGKIQGAGPFRWLSPGIEIDGDVDGNGQPTFVTAGPELEMMWVPGIYSQTSLALIQERVFGVDFRRWAQEGYAGGGPRGFDLGVDWWLGPTPHYAAQDLDDLYLGFTWGAEAEVEAELASRVTLSYAITLDTFRESAFGDAVYNTVIHRAIANANFTRTWRIRTLAQIDPSNEEALFGALLAWEKNYGTVFYLGYDEARTADLRTMQERSVFLKLGVLWRNRDAKPDDHAPANDAPLNPQVEPRRRGIHPPYRLSKRG